MKRILLGLAAMAIGLTLVGIGTAGPAAANTKQYPQTVTVAWQMATVPSGLTPGQQYPNGPFTWPQTKLDGMPTPGCEPVAVQVDTYTLHNKQDAAYLAGLTTLNSPADDARLSPHDYYAEVFQDSSLCVQTVDVPAKPDVTAPTCDADGSFTLPANTDAVKWTISPDYAGPGDYVVSAHTTIGNVFPDGTRGPVNFDITVLPKLTGDDCAPPTDTTTPPPPATSTTTPPPATHTTTTKPAPKSHIAPPVVVHKVKSSPVAKKTPLASTGVTTGEQLGIAFALLLLGTAALVYGSGRRFGKKH